MTSDGKTRSGDKGVDAPPPPHDVPSHSDDALSGFGEIEDAFDRVSSVADALLDSIRDDSLRGRQRRDSRRRATRELTISDFEDGDDDDDDDDTLNDDFSFGDYGGLPNFDDDDSLLGDGESVDGSLVHDMKNLKSVTRAIQEELVKEGEAFHVNVKKSDNGKLYFQKLQAKAEAEAPKVERLNIQPSLRVRTNTKQKVSFSADKKTRSSRLQQPPVAQISISKPHISFLQELQRFSDLLGKNPNMPFLMVNILVWLLFCRLVYVGRSYLMNDEGVLAPPLGSAVVVDVGLGPEIIEY